MRIFVNAIGSTVGGGVTYLKGLIGALARLDQENEYILGVRADRAGFYESAQNFREIVYDRPSRRMPVRFLWEQLVQPTEMRRLGVDLLFMPHSYGAVRPGVTQVVCLQVPYPVQRYANTAFHKLRWKMRNAMLRACIPHTAKFITVSDDLRHVVHEMFGIPLSAMVPIHHGASLHFSPGDPKRARAHVERHFGVRSRYLLLTSDLYTHKNCMNLVRAFAAAQARLSGHQLLIAGDPTDRIEYERIRQFLGASKLSDRVRFLGRVSWDHLQHLYVGADGFVFPSKHETFGLPPLEAMACGVPAAASRSSCIPEICGDAPRYFDPDDVADMADALVAIAEDEALRARLIEGGRKRIQRFTWEACAAKHLEVFQAAFEGA